jgi:hypothetical protein
VVDGDLRFEAASAWSGCWHHTVARFAVCDRFLPVWREYCVRCGLPGCNLVALVYRDDRHTRPGNAGD